MKKIEAIEDSVENFQIESYEDGYTMYNLPDTTEVIGSGDTLEECMQDAYINIIVDEIQEILKESPDCDYVQDISYSGGDITLKTECISHDATAQLLEKGWYISRVYSTPDRKANRYTLRELE